MERRRLRFDHLVPAQNAPSAGPDKSRTTALAGAPVLDAAPTDAAGHTLVRKRPRDLSLRDWAIYLLSNAAEVEHALLVQYLYASYSLNPAAAGPAASDPTATVAASSWIKKITKIAVEEMGHLLTIQNILRFIGGPISFEREDFPLRTDIYPFPFQLEPLTKDVLAKYVHAEMPVEAVDPAFIDPPFVPTERQEIEDRAMRAAGVKQGSFVNHVGTLYATLLDVFATGEFQHPETSGFPSDTARYQALAVSPWEKTRGNDSIHPAPPEAVDFRGPRVLSVNSIQDVLDALGFIASQGERSDKDAPEASHFGRFLKIYREFPEAGAAGWPVPPAFPVSTNPTGTPNPVTAGTILHPVTQLWSRLFDLRYRMLLTSLVHVAAIPASETRDGRQEPTSATATLVNWVFNEMKDRTVLNLRDLATKLAQMPSADSADARAAGAPFGMPYTLAIPDRDPERWQYHLDLLASSDALVAVLSEPPMDDPRFPIFAQAKASLPSLIEADEWRRQQIKQIINGL
jgi:hypothetical protein